MMFHFVRFKNISMKYLKQDKSKKIYRVRSAYLNADLTIITVDGNLKSA